MNNKAANTMDGIPRGCRPGNRGRVAEAYFASPEQIAKSSTLRLNFPGNHEAKFCAGAVWGEERRGPDLSDGRPDRWIDGGQLVGIPDDRHICTIAGSRAGKGRSAIMLNLATYPGSVFVIATKGELAEDTAEYRAETLGQEVDVLDPFGESGKAAERYGAVFNPIDLLTDGPEEMLVPNANLIADALVVPSGGKDSHWDDTARQMIGGLSLHVATHLEYEGRRDLITVWELASKLGELDPEDDTKFLLESEMESNPTAGGAVAAAAKAFFGRTGGELSSVRSTVEKNLAWIAYGPIKRTLRGPSIDFRTLKTESRSVYVCLPAMQMHSLAGWLRLVVQLALAACESVPVQPKHPVLFVLDEFHALGRMKSIETAIAQIAGFGAKLWILLQDIGQLKSYPNWESFIANVGVLQIFGNNDMATLEYVSRLLGNTQVLNPSVSAPTYDAAVQQAATGESWSLGSHPLLSPHEIATLFGRDDPQMRQLILRPGRLPLILQRVFYDKHRAFRGLLGSS